MTTRQYRVLAAANGVVIGRPVHTGDLILLTDAEALYELDLGKIELAGSGPTPPPVVAIGDPDTLALQRGGVERRVGFSAFAAAVTGTGTGTPAPSGPSPIATALIFG